MKKFLAILLSALLVAAVFAIPASAATWKDGQTQIDKDSDGVLDDWVFDNAYGYVFDIDDVNGKMDGEDGTIITNADAYMNSNPNWAINVLLAPVEGDVYEVVSVIAGPGSPQGGLDKGINFDDGKIVMIIHSSASYDCGYANWEQKVAAKALKAGDKITFSGIDLEAGTATEGKATVQDDPADSVVVTETFWVTHFNDNTIEGAGSIFTAAYTGAGWWYHVAFAPVEGLEGVYEVVSFSDGTPDGKGVAQAIPEGGFVWAANYGNDYSASNGEDYTNAGVKAAIALASTWKVGDKFTFQNLDLEGKTAQTTTSDILWHNEGYVCTTTISNYVAGAEEEVPAGPIYVEKVVSSYKDYTHSTLYRQLNVDPWGWSDDADIAYPDDELKEKLTNGAVAKFEGDWDNFWADNSAILGFHGSVPAFEGNASYEELGYNWIRVDLGAAANLNKFTLTAHNLGEADCVNLVKVFVSSDNETWTEVGSDELEVTGDQKAVIELDEAVSAQYVEYRFSGGAHWQFVSEVEAIEVVERVIVDNVKVPVSGTDTPCQYLNGEVIIWNAGEEDTVITSDDANLRYSWFIVTDAEGKVVKIGNNLVKASEGKVGFINDVTVPANGKLIAFFYNADNNTNEALMGVYNDVLLVANNGAAIYNTVIDVESDYVLTVADGEVAIDCTAQSTTTPGGSDDDENKKPGDMSNMIVFALLAVVAIAGSAVVIKTRR